MNMQKLFFGLLLWVVPFTLFAQRTISGRITDSEDGDPISGVSVFIANTTIGITTDTAGFYHLVIPSEGSYRLVVSHVSYQPVFKDIKPGQMSETFNAALQIRELEEVAVVKKVKFRSEDIDLFWETILGKNPSKGGLYATNLKSPYFYYDDSANILTVTCREPLNIINNETGYSILYVLKYFIHDYNTKITNWEGEFMFNKLAPKNLKEQNTWENNRKKVYSVSVTHFIRSLYRDSLIKNGFALFKADIKTVFSNSGMGFKTVLTPFSSNDFKKILQLNESKSYKTLYIPADTTTGVMLACFGKPVARQDRYNILSSTMMKSIGLFRAKIHTNGDSIRIFPDGTWENQLSFSSVIYYSEPLTGLNMTLPVEYGIEELRDKSEELRTKSEELSSGNMIADSLVVVAKRFERQLSVFPQEKVYLQTDKPYYLAGERIWFRAHVADAASHLPDFSANYVYAELFDARDSVVSRAKAGFGKDAYSGYLSVPENLPEGNYTLRAYTNLMRELDEDFFFIKNIHIINPTTGTIQNVTKQKPVKTPSPLPLPLPEDDFDVSFYPEGGNALVGCMGRIAVKAMLRDGTSINVSGKVFDREGNEITQFKTDIRGMGQFMLTPERGKTCYAVCTDGKGQSKQFNLPAVKEKGYALSAAWNKDRLMVKINHAPAPLSFGEGSGERFDTLCLLVHTRGVVQDVRILENPDAPVAFPKDLFPSGVSNLLLLDRNMLPLSERLVFVNNEDDQAKVTCVMDSNSYAPRSPVEFTLNLADESGEPLQGNVSVAVTDDGEVAVDTTSNILTSLLLTSDLRGNIFDPAFYFQKTAQSDWALDLLMLTQGWRRYDTERIVRNDIQYPDTLSEKEYGISGTVTQTVIKALKTKKLPAGNVSVNILSVNGGYYGNTLTDSLGRFYLSVEDAPDSTWFAVQAGPEKRSNNFELTLDKAPCPKRKVPVPVYDTFGRDVFAKYADKAEQQYTYEHGMRMIQLKEITVNAKKLPERKSSNYLTPDYSLTEEQIDRIPPSSLTALFMRVPRVRLSGSPGKLTLSIAGLQGDAYVLIDGMPVIVPAEARTSQFINPSIDALLVASDVAQVDVLTSPGNLVAFGFNGGGGVIAIYTKTGKGKAPKDEPYIKRVMPLGFQKPVEFYAPKYDSIRIDSKPDLRTTIHWQPSLTIDESGKASFRFYTADTPSTYSVVIEGVTDNGKIAYKREKIKVGVK